MKSNTETIVDESGIQILVSYAYELTKGFVVEASNPSTFVPDMVYTELTSVEVVIAGKGLDILPQMNYHQKEAIISLLNYE